MTEEDNEREWREILGMNPKNVIDLDQARRSKKTVETIEKTRKEIHGLTGLNVSIRTALEYLIAEDREQFIANLKI